VGVGLFSGRCLVGLGVDMPTGLLFGWRVWHGPLWHYCKPFKRSHLIEATSADGTNGVQGIPSFAGPYRPLLVKRNIVDHSSRNQVCAVLVPLSALLLVRLI